MVMRMIKVAVAVLAMAGIASAQESTTIPLEKKSRVVLVGNGLGSRMLHFGHFETGLHLRYPDHELFIRNMCRGNGKKPDCRGAGGLCPKSPILAITLGANSPW